MAITILRPAPAAIPAREDNSSDDSDDGGVGLQGDIDMPPAKRARHRQDIVTPGEIVTDDPQWMRCVVPHIINRRICLTYDIANTRPEAMARLSPPPAQES